MRTAVFLLRIERGFGKLPSSIQKKGDSTMKARKLFVLALACMASVIAQGKTFSLDLCTPSMGGRVARAKLAASQTDSCDGALRRVNLDAGAADVGEVAVGDELAFALFDDVAITLTLKKQMPSPLGGDVFLAEAAGYDGVKNAVVLRTAEGLTVDIQDYRNKKVYKVISTATGVAVQELEAKGGSCGCDALEKPNKDRNVSANVRKAKKIVADKIPDPDGAFVDILVAYDAGAVAWANDNGGITNFALTAVNKMNAVLANNGLDDFFRFRLVGIETVSASSRNLNYALNSVTDGVGDWAPIKVKREELGADIVTVLVDTGSAYGTTGLGWSLESDNIEYFSDSAYNACAIRSVAQSHTMTHEVGHNMGCGHSDIQQSSPGPQLYGYSAGYYFSVGDDHYHTIMAYDGEGPGGDEVPYFSSPSHAYNGVNVGDETHNNRLTLYNTYGMVSRWRTTIGDEIDDGGDDDPGESTSSDNFVNARRLTGASGTASFNNEGYTKEPGEPKHSSDGWDGGASAWATWTAPETGDWTFWLTGTLASNADEELDTQLAIYTGTSLGSLTSVAANDDISEDVYSSRVSFHATKGVEYKIAMDTYEGAVGTMKLRWENRDIHYVEFEYDTMFASASGDKAEIAVSSSTGWSVVDYPDWAVMNVLSGTTGAKMTFSVKPNSTGAERTGAISVQAGNSEQKSFTIRQHVVDFVTTKDAAVAAARRMNRRILLVMGRESCWNTQATLFNSIPSSTVWPLWDTNLGYVLWYSNCDRQSDAYGYASGLGSYTLPLVCIIDPQDMSKYVDRVTGYQNEDALKSFLDRNAGWIGLPAPATYTVIYNPGANGTGVRQTATKVENVALVLRGVTFTRTGYTQSGWAKSDGGVKAYALSASYTANAALTLYPVWTANNYKVTFNAQGGSLSTTTKTVTYNSSYGSLPSPTLAGYTFEGWYTAANGGTLITASSKVSIAANHTLYAKWKPLPSIPSYAGTLDTAFARALTVDGALYENGVIAGTMQVKVGKISKKGVVKVSAAATLLIDGKAKKVTAKAVNVVLDATGRISPTALVFKAPIGEMVFAMGADGTFTLKNASYAMVDEPVGGALHGGSGGTFRLKEFDLDVPGVILDDILPFEEGFGVTGVKWQFAKAATVKWAKDRVTKEYDLVVDDSRGKTNLSGLKLTYTAKTGIFKGSFKAYALEEKNGKMKLMKYTVNVIGLVVNGKGVGEASCKRPAGGPWAVSVE